MVVGVCAQHQAYTNIRFTMQNTGTAHCLHRKGIEGVPGNVVGVMVEDVSSVGAGQRSQGRG